MKQPVSVLALAAIAVAVAAPGLLKLQLRTDGHALVPANAPAVREDADIRARFGLRDPFVVLIETTHADGIFNPKTLLYVKQLTERILKEGSFGVAPEDVFSLATEHGHRVVPGTLRFRRFLDVLPDSREARLTLRDDLRKIRLYEGTLVGRGESSTAVMVGAPPGVDRVDMYAALRSMALDMRDELGLDDTIRVIGAPAAESLLGSHLLSDLGVPGWVLGHGGHLGEADPLVGDGEGIAGWIAAHVGLVPVAVLVIFLVFVLIFRSLPAAAIPLIEVGAALVFVFGLMGWFGVPVYLTIAVLPVILTAIGIADEIHIYDRFRAHRRESAGSASALTSATMADMAGPVVMTSTTTAVGFLSFALSPIAPVRAFGLFAAIGVLFCMVWSLTVVPAMLAMMPLRWHASAQGTAESPPAAALRRFAAFTVKYRVIVVALSALLLAAAPLAISRIEVQDSWIDGFSASSDFRQSTTRFNDRFLGMHTLLVVMEAPPTELKGQLTAGALGHHTLTIPRGMIDDPRPLRGWQVDMTIPLDNLPPEAGTPPERPRPRSTWIENATISGDDLVLTLPKRAGSPLIALEAAHASHLDYVVSPRWLIQPTVIALTDRLATFIERQTQWAVGGVMAPADYLVTTNLISRGLKEDGRKLPDTQERADWLWTHYERIRGHERRMQIVSDDMSSAVLTVFLKDANFKDTARLLDEIRGFEEDYLNPAGISLRFGGDVAVSQTLISAIVTTQVESLLLSLVGVALVATALGRSLRFGLLAVLPCAFAVTMNFAYMGATGMPLGVATSMFAGMTLGIGVDFAIHWLAQYRKASARLPRLDAIAEAAASTGPAILIDGVAVALGFGILTMSSVPANARLGALVVMSLGGCLVATLMLLPSLTAMGATPSAEAREDRST